MVASRLNYYQYLSQEIESLTTIESRIDRYPLSSRLIELVKLRVSQINGCAFCVSYHTRRLRQMGESTERIDLSTVWWEAPCFTDQEQTGLRWAEAVTQIAESPGIEDSLYDEAVAAFGEEGTSQLTLAVAMINTWNRLAVSFRTDPKHVDDLLKSTHPA